MSGSGTFDAATTSWQREIAAMSSTRLMRRCGATARSRAMSGFSFGELTLRTTRTSSLTPGAIIVA